MESLIIENFLIIKYAEIEIKKINVIIGEQSTGKSIIVKINDRGPFVKGRIIDLSCGGHMRGYCKAGCHVRSLRDPIMTIKANTCTAPGSIVNRGPTGSV